MGLQSPTHFGLVVLFELSYLALKLLASAEWVQLEAAVLSLQQRCGVGVSE